MSRRFHAFTRRDAAYRGSALLQSSWQRMLQVLVIVVLMWTLTGWAMDWW